MSDMPHPEMASVANITRSSPLGRSGIQARFKGARALNRGSCQIRYQS